MAGPVLAIRLRALGDVVLTTPALRALARGHREAPLEVVTETRYAPLLEGLEHVARVWPLDRTAGSTLTLARALRRRRYALAVDFFGNPRSAFLTAACGARQTAGFDLPGRRLAYRVRVPRDRDPAPGRREYAAEAHLRLAAAVGGHADGTHARVALGAGARAAAAEVLARAGVRSPEHTVGLVAAGTWGTKTWPLANVGQLARRLLESGREVLLLAGPGEEAIAARLRILAPGVAFLPPCDVAALAAVIARLGAVVGTDSGPRHLAAALGVPTFAWFGPTHPDTWNPPGESHGHWRTAVPCRACDLTICPHWSCLPGLGAETASRLVLAHLERHARSAAALDPAARA